MSNHKGRADYDERREHRIERLNNRADKLNREASATWDRGRKMADVIPFGQPILIGHHSEKRDRNYRARIDNTFRKAHELTVSAGEAVDRAAAAERNDSISSDNPEAVELLRAKLDKLEARQADMIAANFAARKSGTPRAFEPYELQNNGANIRRIRERIESLEKLAALDFGERVYHRARIIDDKAENRIRIEFADIPSEEVRESLKRQGFKWSKYAGAWVRLRNNAALASARYVLETGAAAEVYCQAVPFLPPTTCGGPGGESSDPFSIDETPLTF